MLHEDLDQSFIFSLSLFIFYCLFYLWALDYIGTGVGNSENVEDIDDEEIQAAFEKWKSKTYALTVPLRVVSLSNSFPPVWLKVC